VAYEELVGSPQEQFTARGFEAVRMLKCAWPDRLALAGQLLGSVKATGEAALRVLPSSYPHFPRAQVTGLVVEPLDTRIGASAGDTRVAAYQHAKLTVRYGTQSYDVSPQDEPVQPYVTEALEPTGEFITLSARELYWSNEPGSGGVALADDEAPGKLVRGLDWIYTRHSAVSVPDEAFTLIGSVNSAAVTSRALGYVFAAQTLLYNPPHIRRVVTSEGRLAWELAYRFTYRPATWNRFWRTATASFEELYDEGGLYRVYPTAAFAPLLEG
jgi:hypothetical protein